VVNSTPANDAAPQVDNPNGASGVDNQRGKRRRQLKDQHQAAVYLFKKSTVFHFEYRA
jgi:hypothetical protein